MPATIKIANHEANLIFNPQGVDSRESLLDTLHGANTHGDILQSSLDRGNIPPTLLAHKNGFVEAVTAAYSRHHHLTLRPEDIWLAIISQFSLYVNKNAKKLRGKFVAHEGQKKLEVVYENTMRYDVDFADFAHKIRCLISKNVVDDEICGWITPDFSTTTKDDIVVANIMMMGALQAYFRYVCRITCGIPSVTLLGIKQDYEEILRRLENVGYGHVEMNKVASGFTKVPVHLIDNGIEIEAEMIAGSVGVNCTGSGKPSADGTVGLDTMQNHLGWFMYERHEMCYKDRLRKRRK
ncbi:hypothetical protein PG984_016343 [Apiospora sp. TS-2023a]